MFKSKKDKKEEKVTPRNLQEAVDEIRQRFGEGAIMNLRDIKSVDVDVIPTGSFSLDTALGVGGVPRGRVIEIYGGESSGKTTLALHIIAEAQKKGGTCAFIDAEHALDPDYAQKIGVKVDDLLISQPDSGEQALQIVETLTHSGTVSVIVIDSVAALTPKAEIAGEMGEFQIGLQARLMSSALRKLSGITAKSNTLIIFINQTRMKIGVMFGCFSYDSLVTMADGSKKKIGEIVNQELPAKVLSYNFQKQCVESQQITDWHKNGKTNSFLQFSVQNHTGNGRRGFSCTPEHKIYTKYGWEEAKNLRIGDEIMTDIYIEKFSETQKQILIGSVLGDGNLKKDHEQTAYFREEHGPKQIDYVQWLGESLGNLTSNLCLQTKRNTAIMESRSLLNFGDLFAMFYLNGRKVVPEKIVKHITPQSLAVWYCGDGSLQTGTSRYRGKVYTRHPRATLYTNGFRDKPSQEYIIRIFKRFNIQPTFRKIQDTHALLFSVSEAPKFFELIAPYVPPSMQYKLPISYRGFYKKVDKQNTEKLHVARPMKIKGIKQRIPYRDGERISKQRFDISVAQNHNYFVDGCLVSNSPETTPGGLALKFYASVRIDLRRIAQIKQKDEIVGARVRAKIVKNKVAAPFKTVEFDIYYGQGISKFSDFLNAGIKQDLIKKIGNTYTFGEEKLGVGIEAAKNFLKQNPETVKKLKKAIEEKLRE